MIIIRGLHNYTSKINNLCMSMGNFDGLHLGHQKVIKAMINKATEIGGRGMILTFDPHPRWVLSPEAPTLLLTTLHERAAILSRLGLDILLLVKFDRLMARLDPELFVKQILVERLNISEVFVGKGFSFGYKKSGDIRLLKSLSSKYGFHCTQVELEQIDGRILSSTIIRDKIQAGRIEEANRLLGHDYCFTGRVIRGSGRGLTLGYPTANLKVISKVLPPKGVYIVKIECQGKIWNGLANLGSKPTFGDDNTIGMEVYILDLNEKLYGQKINVFLQKRIREEIKFPSSQDLIKQIKKDIQKVNTWAKKLPSQT